MTQHLKNFLKIQRIMQQHISTFLIRLGLRVFKTERNIPQNFRKASISKDMKLSHLYEYLKYSLKIVTRY